MAVRYASKPSPHDGRLSDANMVGFVDSAAAVANVSRRLAGPHIC